MNTFWKLTPGGNPTILLPARDIPAEHRVSVARAVMSPLHIGAEQVGYITLEDTPRLDMMGGEFCLNATRAFALVLAREGLLHKKGEVLSGEVEVSGVREKISVQVHVPAREHTTEPLPPDSLPFVEACLHFKELPVPKAYGSQMQLVRVPGIAHIVQEGPFPEEKDLAAVCAAQRATCQVEHEEAVGNIWVSNNHDSQTDSCRALTISPVVWVRDTSTLCHETACGSGTLAAALADHARTGATRFSILQPSGYRLSVRMEKKDSEWNVWVGGPVRMTACGDTDLSGIL